MDFAAPIDSLPPLCDVIAAHDLRADKKFGQNFLLDRNITDKIARVAVDMKGGSLRQVEVVEIGPGPGGLTRSLLRTDAGHVTAIEYDPRAVAALDGLGTAAGARLQVVQGDALTVDVHAIGTAPRMIVANLPYNIATPLLLRWLRDLYERPGCYDGMVLMFQKEVAQRLVAAPSTPAYGRLSVMTQFLCRARIMFDLPPSAFTPPPKVTSSVVRFDPLTQPRTKDMPSFAALERLCAAAFNQRRKMLKSGLKAFPGLLERAEIDGTRRAEQLSVAEFMRLAAFLDAT